MSVSIDTSTYTDLKVSQSILMMNKITFLLGIFLFTSANGLPSAGSWPSYLNTGPYSEARNDPNFTPNQGRSSSCLMPTGEVGECVSYYSCPDAPMPIYDKGSMLACPHPLEVCCSNPQTGKEDFNIS
ncbi:uncharacterized protein LOC110997700 [Pieris rapae]|uniref:uncharacterized protein LOC110997700 n=1 Tax=Pieris rapae TaxID=64459 RepID=UPI001E27B6DC|nr:uncharacterized protein LOC110997700 [Pieris rapae]